MPTDFSGIRTTEEFTMSLYKQYKSQGASTQDAMEKAGQVAKFFDGADGKTDGKIHFDKIRDQLGSASFFKKYQAIVPKDKGPSIPAGKVRITYEYPNEGAVMEREVSKKDFINDPRKEFGDFGDKKTRALLVMNGSGEIRHTQPSEDLQVTDQSLPEMTPQPTKKTHPKNAQRRSDTAAPKIRPYQAKPVRTPVVPEQKEKFQPPAHPNMEKIAAKVVSEGIRTK